MITPSQYDALQPLTVTVGDTLLFNCALSVCGGDRSTGLIETFLGASTPSSYVSVSDWIVSISFIVSRKHPVRRLDY